MTRKEVERQTRQADTLRSLGFTDSEAESLRRISMTLRRWYEAECNGDIQRDETTGIAYAHYGRGSAGPFQTARIADRETGAIKRLKGIMGARNARFLNDSQQLNTEHDAPTLTRLAYYLQTDPRGASLYIIRPGDVPDGADVSSYYSRGIVVY